MASPFNMRNNSQAGIHGKWRARITTKNPKAFSAVHEFLCFQIDNRFVENMPLNGRSFSALIDLTPGAVLVPNNFFEEGQFSVNGQRPDANYFMSLSPN